MRESARRTRVWLTNSTVVLRHSRKHNLALVEEWERSRHKKAQSLTLLSDGEQCFIIECFKITAGGCEESGAETLTIRPGVLITTQIVKNYAFGPETE